MIGGPASVLSAFKKLCSLWPEQTRVFGQTNDNGYHGLSGYKHNYFVRKIFGKILSLLVCFMSMLNEHLQVQLQPLIRPIKLIDFHKIVFCFKLFPHVDLKWLWCNSTAVHHLDHDCSAIPSLFELCLLFQNPTQCFIWPRWYGNWRQLLYQTNSIRHIWCRYRFPRRRRKRVNCTRWCIRMILCHFCYCVNQL